ncbi:hypothetical protein K438DRAFT_1929759 [Mycena galopus ATCC 62051]|nr:hypothetical protein K438DRAFT_1929759 [Mycena galopus ATCC 62051]
MSRFGRGYSTGDMSITTSSTLSEESQQHRVTFSAAAERIAINKLAWNEEDTGRTYGEWNGWRLQAQEKMKSVECSEEVRYSVVVAARGIMTPTASGEGEKKREGMQTEIRISSIGIRRRSDSSPHLPHSRASANPRRRPRRGPPFGESTPGNLGKGAALPLWCESPFCCGLGMLGFETDMLPFAPSGEVLDPEELFGDPSESCSEGGRLARVSNGEGGDEGGRKRRGVGVGASGAEQRRRTAKIFPFTPQQKETEHGADMRRDADGRAPLKSRDVATQAGRPSTPLRSVLNCARRSCITRDPESKERKSRPVVASAEQSTGKRGRDAPRPACVRRMRLQAGHRFATRRETRLGRKHPQIQNKLPTRLREAQNKMKRVERNETRFRGRRADTAPLHSTPRGARRSSLRGVRQSWCLSTLPNEIKVDIRPPHQRKEKLKQRRRTRPAVAVRSYACGRSHRAGGRVDEEQASGDLVLQQLGHALRGDGGSTWLRVGSAAVAKSIRAEKRCTELTLAKREAERLIRMETRRNEQRVGGG